MPADGGGMTASAHPPGGPQTHRSFLAHSAVGRALFKGTGAKGAGDSLQRSIMALVGSQEGVRP
eukprot:gene24810-10811_t